MSKEETPQISTVLLNWNRCYLLKKTVYSYLRTISVPYELIIIDNGSTDGSQSFIRKICQQSSNCDSLLLSENFGGKAFNFGLKRAQADFLHVSENDVIYKSEWDKRMLNTFKHFPELGQLSVFTPFSRKEMKNRYDKKSRGDYTIYTTDVNVGTSSIFRRKIWEQGIRWNNFSQAGKFKFPDDHAFSQEVLQAGYLVARTHENLVVNHGHQIDEFLQNSAYYIENYKAKGQLQRLKERLQNSGYRLKKTENTDLGYEIVSIRD